MPCGSERFKRGIRRWSICKISFLAYGITSKIIEDHKGDHNNVKGINIYSERGEEFLAEQIVNFESEYETFSIEHIVNDRSAYLYGVSLVFDEIENLSNFTLGLETILAKKISIFSWKISVNYSQL